ncbi:hypothetical protein GCM10010967_32600 [Dyadobacter beijingensis]|uniref:Secreted protein (Por secretion system target) n=2 Tax=Dyadobacter beijingensis TaxID=365489 RepID=A0ABQ2I3A1_9BACT|nr:hypothetical protein GCM10010967_32600 [Dyadobacter beijingensis]
MTSERHQKLLLSKSRKQIYDDVQKRLKTYMASAKAQRTAAEDVIYNIPVVVHIIEPQDRSLLTDQQVIDGIAALNKAFRNQLPESDGVDTKIQFQLAVRAPDCSPTNGINRIYPNNPAYTTFGVTEPTGPGLPYDQVYPLSYWSNLEYYNIWVVNYMDQAAAFAHFPTGGYSATDGTMTMSAYFNSKVLPHELGHGMNLWHTFARGIGMGDLDMLECPVNNNCAEDGDGICDTEPVNKLSNYVCYSETNPLNPCNGNQPFGTVLKNYMGYNGETCQTQFTSDQRARMRSAIELLRPGLINSKGLDPFVVGQTIPKGTTATLTASHCIGVILWYDAPVNGNYLTVGNSFVTPVLNESTTFYAACHRLECPSANRVPGVATVASGLPVQLVRFSAEPTEQNRVALSWATAWETGHDYFELESSPDGKAFRTVGRVSAPVRETGGMKEYAFTDTPAQLAGIVYYRLKQVDRAAENGSAAFAYSRVIYVKMQSNQMITISPNPVDDLITISGMPQGSEIEVVNAGGVVVHQAKNRNTIDAKGLPAGLYIVRVMLGNGEMVAERVVKR